MRGIAVILMIIYHMIFDLAFFNIYNFGVLSSPFWEIIRDMIAGVFFLLVGISLHIHFKNKQPHETKETLIKKYLIRGIKIFSWGIVISLLSYLLNETLYVRFGALHLIGFSIVLAIPFIFTPRKYALFMGVFFAIYGLIINQMNCDSTILFLGCSPETFQTFDYFPIFPWSGLVLIGLWLGSKLFHTIPSLKKLQSQKIPTPLHGIVFLGKNSLLIYLIHQPVIFLILWTLLRT